MKLSLFVLLLLAIAIPVVAQGDVAAAKAAFADLKAKLDAEQSAYRAELGKLRKNEEYVKLRKSGDRQAAGALYRELMKDIKRPDNGAYTEKFMACAKKFAGTDGAVPFLSWVSMRAASQDDRKTAIDMIVAAHLGSDEIGDFIGGLPRAVRALGRENVESILDKVIAGESSKLMKAHAWMSKAGLDRKPRRGTEDPDVTARREQALAKVSQLAPGSDLAARAEAPAFEKNRLQKGMVAPDIEGVDLDGVKFKLSDYRGKVVVIDFWGDW
ncbi:MAG: hypothetical protein CMJ83_04195 [Planctomycetes bacterium]|nr:hypothetical protein [Planctomycetota bacterium]